MREKRGIDPGIRDISNLSAAVEWPAMKRGPWIAFGVLCVAGVAGASFVDHIPILALAERALLLCWAIVFCAIAIWERALIARDHRFRRNPHLCATCGYDLRATPDRCPECGAIPSMPLETRA